MAGKKSKKTFKYALVIGDKVVGRSSSHKESYEILGEFSDYKTPQIKPILGPEEEKQLFSLQELQKDSKEIKLNPT